MQVTVNKEIDLGHLLTIVTILGGIIAWAISEWKRRYAEQREYTKSGAVRLILRLLRERGKPIVETNELFNQYNSKGNKALRKDYCRMNFRFRDYPHFEGAL